LYLLLLGKVLAVAEDVLGLVNPFIGTGKTPWPAPWGAYGGTYPGAVAPYGMVQMTPETCFDPARAGYYYGDPYILGFSIVNHLSGYPNGSHGGVFFMPYAGNLDSSNLRSRYSAELAKPGYYAVVLDDFSIKVELTATKRTGMCRFTLLGKADKIYIKWFNAGQICVMSEDSLAGTWGSFYYWITFDSPFTSSSTASGELTVAFDARQKNVLLMKVGVSTVSAEAAHDNLLQENPDWSLEQVCELTASEWRRLLERIEVSGGDREQREIFYTALYHSFLVPHIWSDVSGLYRGWDGQIHYSERPVYNRFSPWDTFRTKDPLMCLIDPQTQENVLASLLLAYEQTGCLPTGPMTGNHAVVMIVDAYLKGVTGFDTEKAYEAMHKSLMEPPFGRPDIAEYLKYKYVPAEYDSSVTKTLEYAYDDWVLAQYAQLFGRQEDYEELMARAHYWQNVFNPNTRFMEAKTATGEWAVGGYEEGDQWTYTGFVPHDVQGLINLMGGREAFVTWLEECFEAGHYLHDNEPPLHYVYLFNYAGEAWRTQNWVRNIIERYAANPGGLPGNDDLGALSAWYVFSSIGIYPVCPGKDIYVLGSPVFDKVVLHLPEYWGSNIFVIEAKNNNEENKYIQAANLNDHPLKKCWITHQELIHGGYLVLEMGPEPNKKLWSDLESVPPSVTVGYPEFEWRELTSPSVVNAGEEFQVSVVVRNSGSAVGTAIASLYVGSNPIQTQGVILSPGEEREVVFKLTLYSPGDYLIQIDSLYTNVHVEVVSPF